MGCGAVVVLPAGACGVAETARVLAWMAGESAGQCGPCAFGLAAVARAAAELRDGRAAPDTAERLRRWAGQIEGRGACRLPDGAVRLLRSALGVFAEDLQRHLRGGACAGGALPSVLPARGRPAWR
jgi:NADH:ubiquinone oxidoreductase subunit F (NADH-binding)